MSRTFLRLACFSLGVASAAVAGGCGDDSAPTGAGLAIVAPTMGQVITAADDVDPGRAGIQFDVQLRPTQLADTDLIEILLDGATVTTTNPAGTNQIEVPVTFPTGDHVLQARVAARGVASNEVSFTVESSSGGCGSVRYEMPAAPAGGGSLRLGPGDDTDGDPCGASFTTTLVVATDAPDGTSARVTVNGAARGMASVSGGRVSFENVRLDNRGATPNRLAVAIGDGDCDVAFPSSILVECAGPSCTLTRPDPGRAYLNASDDSSAAPGFQADFEVSTDASAVGQEVRLVIDDAPGPTGTVVAGPEGGTATIGNVELAEGMRTVRAECQDAEGNVTSSAETTWVVDSVPCGVVLSAPTEGQLFVDADDLDPVAAGVQVTLVGSASGGDCEAARGGPCSAIDAATFEGLGGRTDLAIVATLGSGPRQMLCAQVRDAAGNVGEARVGIRFSSNAPQLEIVSPAGGTAFNVVGDATHTADVDPATATCEASFVVRCTELDLPVVLSLASDAARSPLPGGSATCTAAAGLPDPFVGEARFPSVSMPRTSTYAVVASQTAADMAVGLSDPVALTGDCEAPRLTINRPSCGAMLDPGRDDEDMAMAGLQHRVVVLNVNEPPPAVTLEIRSGASVVFRETSTMRTGTTNEFPSATFGSGGTLAVEACATDDAGNLGCSAACSVTVSGLPTVAIVAPRETEPLGMASDCDPAAAGLQLAVTATTDAADGAAATVRIGSGMSFATTVMGGQVRACLAAEDGPSVPIVVTVDDARGRGSATVHVIVDTTPPGTPISDLRAETVDRRRGTVRFTWTAVADVGGGRLGGYQLRCGRTPVVTEADWTGARTVAMSSVPAAGGTVQMEVVAGFRTGFREHCSLRAFDVTTALTPIGPSTEVFLPFQEQELGGALPTTNLGYSMAAVGDVNGDGVDDVLAGGNGAAYVYFGGGAGVGTLPGVVIVGSAADRFGNSVAGLGDINADGIADFAVGAVGANGFKGEAYVFFGRPAASAWPAMLDVAVGGCGASLCLRSDDGVAAAGPDESAFLGSSVGAAGDFDGDGVADLAVGAPGANASGSSFPGAVYIVLGSAAFVPGSTLSLPGTSGTAPRGFVVDRPSGFEQFGVAVVGVGNVAGDARGDLIIGAAGNTAPVAQSGVFVLLGRAHPGSGIVGISAAELGVAEAAGAFEVGAPVVNAGDLDGNGMVDLGTWSTARSGGQARYYLGAMSAYVAGRATYIQNDAPSPEMDSFGFHLASGAHPSALLGSTGVLGDLDGDGLCEMLVGANELGAGPAPGELYYSGLLPAMPTEFSRSAAHVSLAPTAVGPTLDRVPQFVGDIDADGYLDVAVGDPGHTAGLGRVVVYH